jgi:hypothetical protein
LGICSDLNVRLSGDVLLLKAENCQCAIALSRVSLPRLFSALGKLKFDQHSPNFQGQKILQRAIVPLEDGFFESCNEDDQGRRFVIE